MAATEEQIKNIPPPELAVVRDFLAQSIPFSSLPAEELDQLSRHIVVRYFRRGHLFAASEENPGTLRLIRRGAAEIRVNQKQLLDRLGEGESFNIDGLLASNPDVSVLLIEDSLIFEIAAQHYQYLRASYGEFNHYFHSQRSRRLRRAVRYQPEVNLMSRKLNELMTTDLLTVNSDMPVREAAVRMNERRVSSALVVDADRHLLGIMTDRDIRSRLVAAGIDFGSPVSHVMTASPQCLSEEQTVFEAQLLMLKSHIHHLPVVSDGRLIGIVTASDLYLARHEDPLFLVQHISRQTSVEGLRELTHDLGDLMRHWSNGGVAPARISRMLTLISDAVTCQLIAQGIAQFGDPPVPFCWMGFGSQGRNEQLLGADQDNGLLISDECKPEQMVWFRSLARYVCDGLNSCGYSYCAGNVMAANAHWCKPLQQWCATVDGWTAQPTPDAVMHVSIFFDVRVVYGEPDLGRRLQQYMLDKAVSNTIFLAALAANVLQHTPPLGIFRRFLIERTGEHRDTVDLKRRGVIPVVDVVRLHALANRIDAVNTNERLEALMRAKVLTLADGRNLQDVFDYLMRLRIDNNVAQLARADRPGNHLNPDTLSRMEREHLRDAFAVINDALGVVRLRYRQGLD